MSFIGLSDFSVVEDYVFILLFDWGVDSYVFILLFENKNYLENFKCKQYIIIIN